MTNKLTPARMTPDGRRDHIVQVAAQHFIRDGYDRASMSAIAEDAGVTRPLVYHYFPGKSALLEAVLVRESEALLEATRPNPQRSADENLRAALANYLDHFSPRSGHAINLTLNAAAAALLVSELIESNHAVLIGRIIDLKKLDDTAFARSVINAWLEFVAALAREEAVDASVSQSAIIEVCLRALDAVSQPLRMERVPPAKQAVFAQSKRSRRAK
ncbi:TetR/AcrR family transcriptional regulator [Bradyrhizobium sp. CCGUVB1N3]|uniref:TetR/AcrR family transcriptional regulator n=1 Tax=Bradyrhizobium sp. CCGUVB1N3 TaxID=2949629 RepID=UPI0020B261C4|nr:TetR/AcrR family transcriptional regulator [Bradyrhizobium sp. CCGUVB1N3]MCP3476775.1 TetR/AcrR family transcriptional regulator [Bradyrhizobium sp. CCGUVB1N3]